MLVSLGQYFEPGLNADTALTSTSLRIPTKYIGGKDYQEKIWDHASGSLLIAESGGIVSDMHGAPLDFSQGRTLSQNEGIVAAGRDVHAKAVESVKKAIEEFGKKA